MPSGAKPSLRGGHPSDYRGDTISNPSSTGPLQGGSTIGANVEARIRWRSKCCKYGGCWLTHGVHRKMGHICCQRNFLARTIRPAGSLGCRIRARVSRPSVISRSYRRPASARGKKSPLKLPSGIRSRSGDIFLTIWGNSSIWAFRMLLFIVGLFGHLPVNSHAETAYFEGSSGVLFGG